MVLLLELAGVVLGALIILRYAVQAPRPARTLADAALVSASAWVAEESCILLYGVYGYHAAWHLFLDQVPLLVVVIWPVVIFSARELTSHFRALHSVKRILAGAAIVAADALFIEPLSVSAGLWSWKLPGLLQVPLIGILGWFIFALLVMLLLEKSGPPRFLIWRDLTFPVLVAAGVHGFLQMAWWGALRWVSFPLPFSAVIGIAWLLSVFITVSIHKNQTGRRIQKAALLMRLPAALFFFALPIVKAADPLPLIAYALAFVPPYAALMVRQYQRPAA